MSCVLSSAFSLLAAQGLYEVREVKPNVFVWIPEDVLDQQSDPLFNRAGTAGFITTSEGAVVVSSTNSPFHARELLYEIRRRTDQPVRYVINTDAAGDRMLGNEVFADQQAIIISTVQAYAEMHQYQQVIARRIAEDFRLESRMRGIHITLPTATFDLEMSLRLGGRAIKLMNLGGGQSAGDAGVLLPDAKVLFLGHLFENRYFPRLASGDVRRWIEILRQLEGWDVEVYVPGYGEPGGKQQLGEFRQFLEWLVAEVEARLQQGKTLAQVRRELLPFERFRWRAPGLASGAVEAVYRQLAAAQPGTRLADRPGDQ